MKTAVEWLEKELNYIEENAYTSYIDLKIQQALEMEKEQIKRACLKWYDGINDNAGKQYYKETFKLKKQSYQDNMKQII
jgi:hypothetical protein